MREKEGALISCFQLPLINLYALPAAQNLSYSTMFPYIETLDY